MNTFRNTVTDTLWNVLVTLMDIAELNSFRLVGGTSLSLLLGHRMSIDIDLFTDAEYGTIDFLKIRQIIEGKFACVDASDWSNDVPGNSCFLGNDSDDMIKLDLYYADPFVFPVVQIENIRLSRLEEICAMKLDVIVRGGRKKDFWDIHKLLDHFTIEQMLGFHRLKYPYHHSTDEIKRQLINFNLADGDFDPNCLEDKYWELIKLDIEEQVK